MDHIHLEQDVLPVVLIERALSNLKQSLRRNGQYTLNPAFVDCSSEG